jgi:PAS domain S-box-containing protein
MDLLFLPVIGLSVIVVGVSVIRNFCLKGKERLHYLFIALGFGIIGLTVLYILNYLGYFRQYDIFLGVFCAIASFLVILYTSFLIDYTATRRLRAFLLLYLLPAPLGYLATFMPRPDGLILLLMLESLLVMFVTVFFSFRMILSAIDEHERRDGEWLMMVFVAFSVGLFLCCIHPTGGGFWLLAIWYFVMDLVINRLKVHKKIASPVNQLIFDNVFDIIILLDSSGKVVRMNRRGYQLTGLPAFDVTGYGIERLVVHQGLDALRREDWIKRNSWLDTGSGSARSPSIDSLIVTRDGEEIPVDLRILTLQNQRKVVTGYVVSATDMRITHQLMKEISDREYAARDLALSESKFSRMFIFNPIGILIVDLESFRITDANPAVEEILECGGSTLPGKPLFEIGLEMVDLTMDAFVEKIQLEGSVPDFAANIRLDPLKVKNCRLSAVSFDLNRTKRMLLSVMDVTQKEHMSEALSRKQKVETIGILAGGIAHDFNNILAVILGHIGLAKMRVVDQHARAPIEKAEQACLRAREMTRQLLAFSRGGKPVIAVCEIRQLIIDSAMLAVNDTSVACLFDIVKDVWPLMADRMQISQVVTNIVGNAVDAMEKSGIIEIQARNFDMKNLSPAKRPKTLDGKTLPAERFVEIKIHDQGPGIPESILSRIFDPFFTTKEKGTGLGLAIVYSVIQNHGGAISVNAGTGSGATFTIYLPAAPVQDEKSDEQAFAASPGTKRVLLMDDEPLVRETASGMLSSLGYEVTCAADGKEAVTLYREAFSAFEFFDFCILDLKVPGGMGGSECAKELLKLNPEAILFVSSGYSDDPALPRFKEFGFRGLIPKPYTLDELRDTLNTLVI